MATIPTSAPTQIQRQLATRSHGKRIALMLFLILGGAFAAAWYLLSTRGTPLTAATTPAPAARPWLKQAESYPDPEKSVEKAPAPPVDTISPELARLRNELLAMKIKLDELDKRRSGTTVVQPQQAHVPVKPPEKRPAPMLYFNKDMQDKPTPVSTVPEYLLAPWATKLPCTIEPLMNSDVEGYFTAKVNTNVYDTNTGRHLLVPQGATIGGRDHGSTLLYGNERLPTTSLALTIGDRTYDLGQAPMMDQLGTNGLTGKVDQHYWRLFGAIFIGGALRGGQQMLHMEMAQAGGAGQIATGIAGLGNQAASQRIGRALETRPTIHVFPGQQCQVLLIQPLSLPAVWQ
jgi:type IV secretory pathway VirB10-like protein